MKKTLTRMTCSAFALILALTCILVPASAANNKLNLSYDGTNSNFSYTVLDENGNPSTLPFQGTGSYRLLPNYTVRIHNDGYFHVPANTWISFSATLSTRAGLAFGCELSNGQQYWKYDESPSTHHQGDFRVSTGGDMYFLIKNTSASATNLTSLYIG